MTYWIFLFIFFQTYHPLQPYSLILETHHLTTFDWVIVALINWSGFSVQSTLKSRASNKGVNLDDGKLDWKGNTRHEMWQHYVTVRAFRANLCEDWIFIAKISLQALVGWSSSYRCLNTTGLQYYPITPSAVSMLGENNDGGIAKVSYVKPIKFCANGLWIWTIQNWQSANKQSHATSRAQ